jgi:hypothetical protein
LAAIANGSLNSSSAISAAKGSNSASSSPAPDFFPAKGSNFLLSGYGAGFPKGSKACFLSTTVGFFANGSNVAFFSGFSAEVGYPKGLNAGFCCAGFGCFAPNGLKLLILDCFI